MCNNFHDAAQDKVLLGYESSNLQPIKFNLKRNRWPPWDIRHSEKKANVITEFLLFLESENNWKDSWLYDDLQKLQKTHFI